jgi:hypothetical protein
MTVRGGATVALGASTLGTFGYALVYVARWEWQRATLVAVFCVLCAVAWSTLVADSRLRRLEQRVAGQPADPARPAAIGGPAPANSPWAAGVRDAVAEAPVPSSSRFRWLGTPPDGAAVFIPVLLGAGLLVSALAWLVERIAHAAVGPVVGRRLVTDLLRYAPAETLLVPASTPLIAVVGGGHGPSAEALLRHPLGGWSPDERWRA